MALEFIDSCAHSGFGASQIPISRKWTSFNSASYVNTPVRTSGVSIAITNFISKSVGYAAERYMGFAYYYPSSSNGVLFLAVMSSGGAIMAYVRIESDLSLSIYTGGNNTRIFNSGAAINFYITADTFHYYEFHVNLGGGNPVTVSCDLKVDGQSIANGSSGSTSYAASGLLVNSAQMNQVQIYGPTGGGSTGWVCDVYVLNINNTDMNGVTTTLTGFLGDVAINALVPVADVTTQWALFPSGSPNSYSLLSEIPPDDDTTYVYTDGVNQVDNFNFQPLLNFNGTLLGAQLLIYAKKDAEGSRAIQGVVGGTSQKNLNSGITSYDNFLYDYYDYFIFPLDTDNGVPWTPDIFNSENFGAKLSI